MTTRIATAAGAGPDTRFFVPFTKVEEKADGSVYVEGIATAEVLDFHGEVVTYEASKAAFERWSSWAEKATDGASLGNIRVMHQPIVAGRAVKWWADDATRSIHLGATIDDPTQAKLCRSRAYTGYSIGGGNVTREMRTFDGKSAPHITNYDLSENSLVDKPACPTATFTLVKRAIHQEPTMKLIEMLKSNLSAVLAIAATMTDEKTVKRGEDLISIDAVEKDAVGAGSAALASLKAFLIEVLGATEETDLWTVGDICEAMRFCYSARMGAQYAVSEAGIQAAAAADLKKSETPADPTVEDPPAETEPGDDTTEDDETDPPEPATEVPPSTTDTDAIENAVKAALAPVQAELAEIKKAIGKPVAATVEAVIAPDAVVKADLTGFATAESVTTLTKTVDAIKGLLEKLPAPAPGTAIAKTIGGSPSTAVAAATPDTIDKAIALIEGELSLDAATRHQLRIKAAARAIRET